MNSAEDIDKIDRLYFDQCDPVNQADCSFVGAKGVRGFCEFCWIGIEYVRVGPDECLQRSLVA
jgi:hypothetical protein